MLSKIFKKVFGKKETEQKPHPNCFILEGGDMLHTEIAFVAGTAEETIPILEKHRIRYMDDPESLSNKKSPRVHVVLCKIRKIDETKWRKALDEIWDNPPTEDYHEVCEQLNRIFEEEGKIKRR